MAYPSLTSAVSGQKSAGIQKVYVKTGSELWQSLGFIRNGELKVTPYSTEDTYKRNRPNNAYTIEAKVELLQTALLEVELIDNLVDGTNSFLFKLSDAAAIPSTAAVTVGWVVLTSSQVGVSAKYQSDGNPSTNQFIELTIKGSVLGTSVILDAALKASIDDGDFHISTTASESYSNNNSIAGGTVFSYYSSATVDDNAGVQANIKPNGFSTVVLTDANGGSPVTLGRVRNGKLIFDYLAEEDSLARPNVYGVDIDVEYELLIADSVNLLALDGINSTLTNVVITLLDGKVFTLEGKLGVNCSFENMGDFDKFRVLKFSHKGRVLVSDIASIVA